MDDFPSNKKGDQQRRQKHIQQVATGRPVRRRRSLVNRLAQSLLSEGADHIIPDLARDIVLPGVRTLLFDAFVGAAERALFGEGSSRRTNTRQSYTSYGAYHNAPAPVRTSGFSSNTNTPVRPDHFRVDPIVLQERSAAESTLEYMQEIVEQYGAITVADLHEMLGLKSTYTQNKWGWEEVGRVQIKRVRDGWLIELPNPTLLD